METLPTDRDDRDAESAVQSLYHSFTEAQKEEVCFPWDYQDPRRGLLRSFVSNHWYVTRPFIRSEFFSRKQQDIIHDIFTSLIEPEWYSRFVRQMKDDTYGQDWGEEQSIAVFGTPGAGRFQFVLTGRHMTLRADGGSDEHLAFGGPILYGHAAGGFYMEEPHHPGNVFWHQAEMANRVYQMLEPDQGALALADRLPPEAELAFRGTGPVLPGIAVAGLFQEQKAELRKVLEALVQPFRRPDRTRILRCLECQGGLDSCHLAFYREGRLAANGPWDNWRLEGPAFIWYFRGAPHVHVWVHVADTPTVPVNAQVRFVVDPLARPRSSEGSPACRVPGRRLVAVSTVKNEIDIVEAFVRHNLNFVDHLVVADNGSTDGTLDVLRGLVGEGLPVTLTEDPSAGKYLSQRMTRLMREEAVARHGADWVVPLDADEFLVIPPGASLIPEGIAPDVPVYLLWRTYVPDSTDDAAKLNPVFRIRNRLVREGLLFPKVMVPRKLAERPEAVLAQGNHVLRIGDRTLDAVPAADRCLAHFPIRGPGQYLAKIAISAFQYHTMGKQAAGLAFHWRAPYELLKRDPEAFAASIYEDARRFSVPAETEFQPETVVDPLTYSGGPLLYTPMAYDHVRGWQAVLAYAEQLADRYAALTAYLTPEERVILEEQINAALKSDSPAPGARLLDECHRELIQTHQALLRELADSREEGARLRAHLEQAARDVRALRRSWTWTVGALMVRPTARAIRWIRALPKGLRKTG